MFSRRTIPRAWLLLLALAVSVWAQNGLIRGKVRAPSGTVLTGVIVELWRPGGLEATTVTTREGDFEFGSLTPDVFEIVIKHEGYQPVSQPARFRFDRSNTRFEVVTVDVTLRPLNTPSSKAPPGTTFVQNVPDEARTAYEQAVARLKDGKAAEGQALLGRAIGIFPDYFDAHFALALEHDRAGRSQEALASLERARAINDRDGRVYYIFGVIMSRERKYVVAEYAFRNALERDPSHAQASFSHGIVLIELAKSVEDEAQRMEKLAAAEKALTRALDLSEQRIAAAYLQRARVYEMRGERRAAATDLTTYLKLNPGDKNADAIREAIEKLKKGS